MSEGLGLDLLEMAWPVTECNTSSHPSREVMWFFPHLNLDLDLYHDFVPAPSHGPFPEAAWDAVQEDGCLCQRYSIVNRESKIGRALEEYSPHQE